MCHLSKTDVNITKTSQHITYNENYRPTEREIAVHKLKSKLPMDDIPKVFFHSGSLYRKYLTKLLEDQDIRCIAPLEGLGIGQQKAWYLKHNM